MAAWECVALLSDLRASPHRKLVRLRSGRGVALFLHSGRVFALDHACYHHGGPLADGDIEDVAGVGACVLCPWHKYKISLEAGESLYVGLDIGAGGARREVMRSKGVRQRAHPIRVVAAAAAEAAETAGTAGSETFSGIDGDDDDDESGAVVLVLDMATVASEAEALQIGGEAAARMFRDQFAPPPVPDPSREREATGGGCAALPPLPSDTYAFRAFNTTALAAAALPLHSSVR